MEKMGVSKSEIEERCVRIIGAIIEVSEIMKEENRTHGNEMEIRKKVLGCVEEFYLLLVELTA